MQFALEVFIGKFGFMQTAGSGTGQILAAKRVCTPRGVAFLSQQDFTACAGLYILKDLQIFLQQTQVNQIAGCLQLIKVIFQC